MSKVYGLYSGPDFPNPSVNFPPVDLSPRTLSEPLRHEVDIDTERVDGIVAFNVFTPNRVMPMHQDTSTTHTNDLSGSCALYILPSLFNHSCDPNATWFCFGDVMVIRSTQDISKGVEITLAYTAGPTHVSRNRTLASFFLKSCDCTLCDEERADGDAACGKREELLKWYAHVEREATFHTLSETTIESQLRKFTATFAPSLHSRIRPALYGAHLQAVWFFLSEGTRTSQPKFWRRSLEHAFMALEVTGFKDLDKTLSGGVPSGRSIPFSAQRCGTCMVRPDAYVFITLHVSRCFLLLKESTRAERWYRAAWWSKQICYISTDGIFITWLFFSSRDESGRGPGIL